MSRPLEAAPSGSLRGKSLLTVSSGLAPSPATVVLKKRSVVVSGTVGNQTHISALVNWGTGVS